MASQQQVTGDVGGILQLLQGLKGTESSSTQSSNITPEGIAALVQKMLEGNAGLANVSSAQKQSGMYNSTTNSMLTNDLLTRIAGEAASANKSTTTTNKQGAAIDPKTAGMGAAALYGNKLLMPSIQKYGGKLLDKGGDYLAGLMSDSITSPLTMPTDMLGGGDGLASIMGDLSTYDFGTGAGMLDSILGNSAADVATDAASDSFFSFFD